MKWQRRGRKGTGHLTAQPLTATHGARPWGPAEAQEPPPAAFFKESGKSRGREQATRDDHAPHASSSVLDQATKSSVIAERCLQNMSPSSPPNPPLPWQHSERQQLPVTYWWWVHTNILSILPLQARLTGAHGRAEGDETALQGRGSTSVHGDHRGSQWDSDTLQGCLLGRYGNFWKERWCWECPTLPAALTWEHEDGRLGEVLSHS